MVDVIKTRVQGIPVQIPVRYQEGHPLSAEEAQALNTYYASRVASTEVTRAKELMQGQRFTALSDSEQQTVQAHMQQAMSQAAEAFQFGQQRRAGRRRADPLAQEIMTIAREVVRKSLRAKGVNLSEIPQRKITELANQVLENKKHREKITSRAERVIAEREELNSLNVDVAI